MDDLAQHWPSSLAAHADLRDDLVARYGEPHRGYHDTRHLLEVLARVDLLLSGPGTTDVDRDAVVLAAWFHDAVYDGRPDDVERSAALAESSLGAIGRREVGAEVGRLVRETLDHRPADSDLAGQVLCDADLGILAARRERYAEYVDGVRREYAHLDARLFRDGRAGVLRSLLRRPHLFHTPTARARWEEAARQNVAEELEQLTVPGSP